MLLPAILVAVSLYLIYNSVIVLLATPWNRWGWIQWIDGALCIILVGLVVINIKKLIAIYKIKAKEGQARVQAMQAEVRAKKRAIYLEDDAPDPLAEASVENEQPAEKEDAILPAIDAEKDPAHEE